MEYLLQADNDMWIDPIEVQRMEDFEALELFTNLAERMKINMESLGVPIYNEVNSTFINVCHTHGVTKKQIKLFTGLSLYKMEKLQKFNKKF